MKILILISIFLHASAQNNKDKCVPMTRRFFECQQLKMKPKEASPNQYEPDSSIPGNQLDESFFINTLGNLTLEQALDLQWTIYSQSVVNCSGVLRAFSEFCKCVDIHSDIIPENYQIYFKNEQNFEDYKQIILNSYEMDESKKTSYLAGKIFNSDFNSLVSFCRNFSFIFDIEGFYQKGKDFTCRQRNEDSVRNLITFFF